MKKIEFVSVATTFNPKHHSGQEAKINPNGSLHLNISVAHDFKQDQWAMVELGVRNNTKANSYRTLLQYDFNICRSFGKSQSKFLTDLASGIFQQGTMPMKCPVMKGNYFWTLNPSTFNIPAFVLPNVYRVIFCTYIRLKSAKEFIGNTSVIVKVTK
ncbi:uncharacterized protein LOC133332103 [Musca vetustissima]|uniref:uncharacterized protein LOC133332103 n=1 Tax=Musca vetustissima TaxID=27455 RepID=UPI002AB700F6|nr:uncharacterized protein LOC133332103 [Musca vetustissima]